MGIAASFREGINAANDYYKGRMTKNELDFQPENLRLNQEMLRANTGMAGINEKFLPSNLMADLNYKKAQTPFVNSQTALNEASLPYVKYKFLSPYLTAQARIQNANSSTSNAFKSWSQTPEGAEIIKNNPAIASSIEKFMNYQSAIGQEIGGEGAPLPQISGIQEMPPAATGMPLGTPQEGGMAAPSQMPGNAPSMVPGGTIGAPNMPQPQLNPQAYNQLPMTEKQVNKLKALIKPQIPATETTTAVQNAAAQKELKQTTDPQARQRNLFATNIEKTLGQINADDLVRYSGVAGTADKKIDQGLAAFGKEPPGYDDYKKSLIAADFLSTQARQFYGDSIQPAMIERLQKLTNPESWSSNPKLAKQNFEETKKILQMELKTYRDAMKGTDVYKSETNNASAIAPQDFSKMSDDELAANIAKLKGGS